MPSAPVSSAGARSAPALTDSRIAQPLDLAGDVGSRLLEVPLALFQERDASFEVAPATGAPALASAAPSAQLVVEVVMMVVLVDVVHHVPPSW